MATYAAPGQSDSLVSVQDRYGNFIGGEFVPPVGGQYFENPTPVTGQTFTEIARSTGEDIERALDAAHGAKLSWGRTSAAERAGSTFEIVIEARQHPLSPRRRQAARLGGPFQKTADDGVEFRLFKQEGVVALVGRDLGEGDARPRGVERVNNSARFRGRE